jgi:hypothetical protein
MVLIKNVIATSKGDKYLKAQHSIIFTKVVDVTTQTCHHDRPIYYNILTNKDLQTLRHGSIAFGLKKRFFNPSRGAFKTTKLFELFKE